MGNVTRPPIPRQDPPDDDDSSGPISESAASADGRATVRPPAGPSDQWSRLTSPEPSSATYQMLRESCRIEAAATEDPELDAELAVEAEVIRVAMDRNSGKP